MKTFSGKYLPSCVELSLSLDEKEEILQKAKDWALMHGLAIRPKDNTSKDLLQHAPFTLLPSTFPRSEFINACEIQTIFNLLIHKVAHDYDFLKDTLSSVMKVDDFTRRLFQIYDTVYAEGFTQKISLGLLRCDVMLDTLHSNFGNEAFYRCKQVEMNTIASGMGALGPISTELHKFVFKDLDFHDLLNRLPENKALEGLCNGMLKAWQLYNDPKAVILFIVEDFALNICDQRSHEFEIKRQNKNVKVLRRTFSELILNVNLNDEKELILDDKYSVAVVYFRWGYSPKHYTEKEWDLRLLIERSRAVKCPSIQYHLAGTKKVQQALAQPGVIERYLHDENMIARVRDVFTGLYSMDVDAAVEMALSNPERFVLKPQREGGGNNIYGNDIKTFLQTLNNQEELNAWILMDRIYPPAQLNHIICDNKLELKNLISELGIFGVIIGDEDNVYFNKQVGHLLRTKLSTSNEGGLMSGTAACDSLFLID